MIPDSPSPHSGLSPDRERPWRNIALGRLLLWALLLWTWGYAARGRFPGATRQGWAPDLERRAPPYARYDSGWYLGIAEHGYGPPPPAGAPSAHAFFPLYPGLSRALAALVGVHPLVAGSILSGLCALAAGLLVFEEGRRRLGPALGLDALTFLLVFPTSFFLLGVYSEALFLLLAALSFRLLGKGRPGAAGAFAFLAGWTRVAALALAVPLAIAALRPGESAAGARSSSRAAAVLLGLAPLAGVFGWILLVGWIAGEPWVYFRAQEGWQRGASPVLGILRWVALFPSRLARGDLTHHPAFLLDYAYALLFFGLAILQARRRRWSDASWTAGALLLPISTGVSASLPRYLMIVYPAFYALAEIFERRPRARTLWWLGSAALLLAGAAAFVNWRWVA